MVEMSTCSSLYDLALPLSSIFCLDWMTPLRYQPIPWRDLRFWPLLYNLQNHPSFQHSSLDEFYLPHIFSSFHDWKDRIGFSIRILIIPGWVIQYYMKLCEEISFSVEAQNYLVVWFMDSPDCWTVLHWLGNSGLIKWNVKTEKWLDFSKMGISPPDRN